MRDTTCGHKAQDVTPSVVWGREAQTLSVDTKPRTSSHRSPGGERHKHYLQTQNQGHHAIDRREERSTNTTCRHKTKDIMPSIAGRREAQTLPADTKPRTSSHRSPGGERHKRYLRAQNQGHHAIDRLEERGTNATCGHKTKDIMPSIAWMRQARTLPADTKPRTSRHRSPGGETLPAGTKPRTSRYRSPGEERHKHYLQTQNQGRHAIGRLDERHYLRAQSPRRHAIGRLEKRGTNTACGHKAKDVTPSEEEEEVSWRREA